MGRLRADRGGVGVIETLIVGAGHTYPVVARVTDPDEPGRDDGGWGAATYAWYQLGYGEQWRDDHFSAHKALTYSVLWGCVSYISQTIASLGWHQFERQARGRKNVPLEESISWLIGMQANPEMNAFDWRQTVLKDALLWGNGYSEIERDGMGRVRNLWRIEPGRVCPERDDNGALYYEVRDPDGGDVTALDPMNVYHLKGLGPDGIVGYSVVEMAKRSIELGLHEERFGVNFFRRGPMPGGVLEVPGAVKKPERDEMRKSFETTYGGSERAGRVVVLSGGAKFTQVTMPNDDAQWIEGRTFQADEICRWFRVPPHKVGLLARSTFSNIEQQSIEAVQDCLLPWCCRLEAEANTKLYGRNTMGRRFTRLNLDSLLRGDSITQTQTVVQKVASALMTPNEGREYLDLNPIDGADELLIQGAMVPLERVLEEPPEPLAPASQPAEPGKNGEQPNLDEQLKKAFGALLAKDYKWLLSIEVDKARRAAKDGLLARHVTLFYPPHKGHVRDKVEPVLSALFIALKRGPEGIDSLSLVLAEDHCKRSIADLARGIPPGWPGDRPARQAEAHLDLVFRSCGGPGSGVPGPCPEEKQQEKGTGSQGLHEQAQSAAKSWGEWAKELPGRILSAAKDKITTKYNQLSERYGKGMALAIMGAGILATPIPVPGTTFVAVAPLIAAGEIYRALAGSKGAKNLRALLAQDGEADGMTDDEITKLGKEWMAEILKEWQDEDMPKLEQENAETKKE
jgi:HK97 family phage portal protein